MTWEPKNKLDDEDVEVSDDDDKDREDDKHGKSTPVREPCEVNSIFTKLLTPTQACIALV